LGNAGKEDSPEAVEMAGHRVPVAQVTERDLENLVSSVSKLFTDLTIPALRGRDAVDVAAHAVEVDADAFRSVCSIVIEKIRRRGA
jgi:hypothetical protein